VCGACSSGLLQPFHRRPSRPFPPVSALPTAGQIGYAICPMIARGAMLGPDQPVILHMLDIEPAKQARTAQVALRVLRRCGRAAASLQACTAACTAAGAAPAASTGRVSLRCTAGRRSASAGASCCPSHSPVVTAFGSRKVSVHFDRACVPCCPTGAGGCEDGADRCRLPPAGR